jgi:hypothetical protein
MTCRWCAFTVISLTLNSLRFSPSHETRVDHVDSRIFPGVRDCRRPFLAAAFFGFCKRLAKYRPSAQRIATATLLVRFGIIGPTGNYRARYSQK